jgi:hypothetical protein
VVFMAWLNGWQDHFVMIGGAQAMRLAALPRRVLQAGRRVWSARQTRTRRGTDAIAASPVRGLKDMRDFSQDTSALALNTATLGNNLDGYGAGWPVERVIDACAVHGFGGIVFWRREIGTRATEIGNRVRAAGLEVFGLCRTPLPRRLGAARSVA